MQNICNLIWILLESDSNPQKVRLAPPRRSL